MAWIRVSKPEYGNKFYNRGNGGYSSCVYGEYYSNKAKIYGLEAGSYAAGYNVLPNCVGLANGAFNETYVQNMLLKDKNFKEKEYFGLNCNAYNFLDAASKKGLQLRTPEDRPPLGGIIVWGYWVYTTDSTCPRCGKKSRSLDGQAFRYGERGKEVPAERPRETCPYCGESIYPYDVDKYGRNKVFTGIKQQNHVAYIIDVIGNDKCTIIQSGYGGWNGGGDDPVWNNDPETISRSTGWKSRYSSASAYMCTGFVVNPAIDDDYANIDPSPVVTLKSVSLNTDACSVHYNSENASENKTELSIAINPSTYDTSKLTTTWTSSDTKIATVSKGTVTGKSAGTAIITVTVKDGSNTFTDTCTVTVTADPDTATAISISDTTIDPYVSKGIPVSVTPTTANLTSPLTWSSSDTSVATITTTGVITSIRGGTTTITVSTKVNGKTLSDTCVITVRPRNGIYIGNKFYIPHVYHNGKWRRLSARVYKDTKWKKSIEKVSK